MMNERVIVIALSIIITIGMMTAQVWFFDWDWRCAVVRCAIVK